MPKPSRCLVCGRVSKSKFCSPQCNQVSDNTDNLYKNQHKMRQARTAEEWVAAIKAASCLPEKGLKV